MKILELELKEFEGVYAAMKVRRLFLDLRNTKNTICLITGPNGHGKTVLLSQLNPFANLGSMDERDALPLIREGKNGYKRIIIDNDGVEYCIEHYYTPNKKTHSVKSYIKKDGVELNINGNVTSFKEIVKTELDMEPEFMKLVRLGNNVVNLIDLKSSERKNFMSKILEDANVYLIHYKKINAETSKLNTIISHIMDKISKLHIDDVDESKELMKQMQAELDTVKNKITKLSNQLSIVQYELRQIPVDYMETLHSSEKALSKVRKKMNSGESYDIDKLRESIISKDASLKAMHDKKDMLKTSARRTLEQMDDLRNMLSDMRDQLEKLESESDIDGLSSIVKSLESLVKKEEELYKDYGEIPYTKKDIEDTLVFFKEKQEVLNRMYEFGPDPVKRVVDLLLHNKNVSEYISEHLEKTVKNLEIKNGRDIIKRILSQYPDTKTTPGCADCKAFKVLNDLREIAEISMDMEDTSQEFYSYMTIIHTTIKSVLLSFPEKKDLFSRIPDYLRECTKTDVILKKIGKSEYIYDQKEFFTEIGFMTDYESYLSHKEELSQKKEELKRAKKDSSARVLRDQVDILSRNLASLDNDYEKMMSQYSDITSQIESTEVSLSELKSVVEVLENYSEVEKAYNESVENRNKHDLLMADISNYTTALRSENLTAKKLSDGIGVLDMNIKQVQSLQKELKVYQKYYDKWVLMKNALSSTKGVPLIFIDLYLKNCLDLVNTLLDEIYGGNMYIKKFGIEQSDFMIPFVKDGKEVSDIRYASQGERSFFSITLSFAISVKSMSSYNIMLLDELDSVLDESNRSNFIAVTEKLSKIIKAEQMFTISHNNMFSMYPVDVISVINEKPKNHQLANYIELVLDNAV